MELETTANDSLINAQSVVRVKATAIAIVCFAILLVAMYLSPDPRGFGTHEQLGLPKCISSNFLGVPCPLCGMTTSFALMAQARPREAFIAQPAGAIFFLVCVATMAAAASTTIYGRVPALVTVLLRGRWLFMAGLLLLMGAWIYKLADSLR